MAGPGLRWLSRVAVAIAVVVVAALRANNRSKTEAASEAATKEFFEPPKYIASLIAAVNDGAKSAQTGALAFTLVGLYLLATAFSTTDEDLLLQHTMPVSQIGVQVPVVVSFLIAPLVLLFLHAYTLIRYDMLSANLWQFGTDLQATVPLEADRERCRQLLANVEFVQLRTAPRGSPLRSLLYRLPAMLILTGFPVATLLAIQISSLRYQRVPITVIQQVSLTLDLALLAWFAVRQRRRGDLHGDPILGWVWYPLVSVPLVLILVLDALYLNVPGADNETVRAADHGPNWSEAYKQPLDLALCPTLQWGCRYLTVDHRTLVGHVWKPEVIADLRAEKGEPRGIIDALFGKKVSLEDSLAAVEGVFLRDRSLRFAKFDQSRLYAADMIGANLSRATFSNSKLQGAILPGARLNDADLFSADLSGANLFVADLSGAHLSSADLSGANLIGALLIHADLFLADLRRANLFAANLRGANLRSADLSYANLSQDQLDQACGKPKALPEGLTLDKPCPPP